MSGRVVIGVDIGGTKTAVVLGRAAADGCEVIERHAFPTDTHLGPDHALGLIRQQVRALVSQAEANGAPVSAVGVAAGGPLDSRAGLILSPPNLPGWDRIPIVALLATDTGLPVRLENDANAGALAEWRFGAGRGTRNMIFCTCGTGFGAGLVLDGRLYAGTTGMAGEIGHVRLAPAGPVGYGKAGSVEGFCSGGGIAQLAQGMAAERLDRGETLGFCATRREVGSITAEVVGRAAEAGDPVAREVLGIAGRRLGEALAILVDLFNPERIVIGGIFPRQHQFLWAPCEETLRQEALAEPLAVCRIVPAELGERIGDIAALTVGLSAVAGS